MFKKNSWIVALLLALTLTALFTGCIEAIEEDESITYTEVELGDYNVWGGQTYQRGWAVGGMKFLGVGDKPEVTKDLGYKNEDFQKATRLVIEMEDDTHPNGNLDLVWGAADENGNSVGYDWKQTGNIKSKKDGNILTIDLTAMTEYATYRGGNFAMRKLVFNAGAEKEGLPFVKKAWLLIPDKEDPLPPDLTIIPGSGDYKVPDATSPDIYIDLNTAIIGSVNSVTSDHYPAAKIEKDKLTINFNWNAQTIFIPFTKETKAKIVAAAEDAYTFDVTITGTQGGHLRWCFGANRTSGWNVTGWGGNDTSSFNAVKNLATTGATEDLFGIIIQGRPTGNADDVAVTPYTVIVNSIKVTPKAPTSKITTVSVTLSAPVAGLPAATEVDGTGWKGAVTWDPPPLANGRFNISTVYTANIVITPLANYYLDTYLITKVNTKDAKYNPVTRTVTNVEPFEKTSPSVQPLPVADLWKLDTWLADSNNTGKDSLYGRTDPVTGNAASPSVVTISNSGANKGVTINSSAVDGGLVNNWDNAFDIKLDKIDDRLDPAFYKIKVVVTGTVLGLSSTAPATGGKIKLAGADDPWAEIATSSDLKANDTFTITLNEIPATFTAGTNNLGKKLRIQSTAGSDNKAYINNYRITSIVISNTGER